MSGRGHYRAQLPGPGSETGISKGLKRSSEKPYKPFRAFGDCECTPPTLTEHIVHIDGVTGSSPVATTNPRKSL